MKSDILYVFGGEKAQGAEIVIQRLMECNEAVNPRLFISPGDFANKLIEAHKHYPVILVSDLKKLNRSNTSGFKFYLTAVKNYFAVSYKTYGYIKKHNIRVVHANTIVPASYLIPLIVFSKLFLRSARFLWSDHDIAYFSAIDHQLSKLCVNLYNRTLVVSAAVKKKYPPNDKVQVLYNGLDTSVFKADQQSRNLFRTRLQLSEDIIVIGMPAVVAPRKGQLELISAFNELCITFPNIFLLFAGGYESATPEYSKEVKNAIAANSQVKHLGYIDSMTDFYNGCDVIVSNSNLAGSEPLGTTIYEAMACEKIVVAADTGGTSEIISDTVDGFLVKPEDQQDLQQKLAYVFTNYPALNYIGSAALNKVVKKFNIATMARNYNDVVNNITSS